MITSILSKVQIVMLLCFILLFTEGCGLYGPSSYWNSYYQSYNKIANETSNASNYTTYVPGMYSNLASTNTTKKQETESSATTSNKCTTCANSNGKCTMCNGTGRAYWLPFYVQCSACYGTGKCPMCHGTGIWVPGTENVPISTGSGSSNNGSSNSEKKVRETVTWSDCSACHGTGYESTRRSAASYGGTKTKEYCSICKGTYYQHYHNPCPVCHGNKKVKRTNYSYE